MRSVSAWLVVCSALALPGCSSSRAPASATGATAPVLPVVRAVDACPVSPSKRLTLSGEALGSGPAYPVGSFAREAVLELAPAANFGSRGWGGQKVLWVQAPGAPRGLVVTGRRLDAPGRVRFDDGVVPAGRLVLPAPERGRWVDRPGFTRLQHGGCYAYVVEGGRRPQVVVFRAVKLAHTGNSSGRVAGRTAQTMERALVEPGDSNARASPYEADCRRPTGRERRRSPFGGSRRVFSCLISDQNGTARYDVQFLASGCYVAELQRHEGVRSRQIQACRRSRR